MALRILVMAMVVLVARAEVDPDCVDESVRRIVRKSERIFDDTGRIYNINDARINSVDERGGVNITVIWSRLDPKRKMTVAYRQELRIGPNNKLQVVGELSELDNVIFLDWTANGDSAHISVNPTTGEEHLTVNTDNAATSCTLKLSFHAGHGPVMADLVFGSFRFSPDGKFIMYVAEEPIMPWMRFLERGYFHDRSKVKRPAVYLYNVEKVEFNRLEQVPWGYSPGNMQWHPDGNHVVGVAWSNQEYNLLYPSSTNTMTRLFMVQVNDGTFHFLTGLNQNHFAPRFSPDGASLVYLQNSLHSSTVPRFYPGPFEMSSRLVLLRWENVLDHFEEGTGLYPTVLVNNSQSGAHHPVLMRDGDKFYGLYPVKSQHIPDRIFSADSKTVYLNNYELAAKRIVAVQLDTRQVTVHHDKELRLLDTMHDVFLVKRGDIKRAPFLAIGRIRHPLPPRPSPTPRPDDDNNTDHTPTTDDGTYTTTTIPPDETTMDVFNSTTLDPCEHLLQELELAKIDRNTTVVDLSNRTEVVVPGYRPDDRPGYRPGLRPRPPTQRPLPLARIEFFNVTGILELANSADFHLFARPSYNTSMLWTQSHLDSTFFNAWYARPNGETGLPLFVHLKGGPHSADTQGFDYKVQRILSMGMAYLAVNYRGSLGMGDEVLQAVIGNIGEMEVEDTHQAIRKMFDSHPELNGDIVLHGFSYGGFIATHLAAKYPQLYKTVILQNPLVDLSAVRSLSKFVQGILGANYSNLFLPDEDYLLEGYKKSPLHLVDDINAATIIFVGEVDKSTVPETQGLSLYNSLRVRNLTTSLYSYPGQGHHISGYEEERHMFVHSMKWMYEHWGAHEEECTVTTTRYVPGGKTTTRRPGQSTTKGQPSSAGFKSTGQMNFISLMVLVPLHLVAYLANWVQVS